MKVYMVYEYNYDGLKIYKTFSYISDALSYIEDICGRINIDKADLEDIPYVDNYTLHNSGTNFYIEVLEVY